MSLKQRVERLERMHKVPEGLTGVLFFHPGLIVVDGVTYSGVEDIPVDVREKYPNLIVGKVCDAAGKVVDVTAPVGGESKGIGVLLVPKPMSDDEWQREASKVK